MTISELSYQIDNSEYNNTISTLTHLPPIPLKISDELKAVLILNSLPISVTSTLSSLPIPTPSATQTLVNKNYDSTGATKQTVYTPTAGKTFYLFGIAMSGVALQQQL